MVDLPSPRTEVPGWLEYLAAFGWRVLAVVGLGLVLISVATLLWTCTLSIIIAILISAAAAPMVARLRAGGRSRTAAAAAGSLVSIGVILVGLLAIAVALVPQVAAVLANIQDGLNTLADQTASAGLSPAATAAITSLSTSVQDWLKQGLLTAVSAASFWATVGILAAFLTFFFLLDGDHAWSWAIQAARGAERDRLDAAGSDAMDRAGGHLRRIAARSALDAAVVVVLLTVLGIPQAGALAALMLIAGFVPYVGRVIAAFGIALVALAVVGGGTATGILLALLVGAILEQAFVTPRLPGRSAELHPAAILVALPAGAAVAGLAGLVLVVPVTAFVTIVGRAVVAVLGAVAGPGPRPQVMPGVPFWLDRAAQWSWRLLVAFGLAAAGVAIVSQLPGLILSLVIAAVLAACLVPLTNYLVQRGRSPGTAALISTAGGFLAVAAIVLVTVLGLVGGMRDLASAADGGGGKIADSLGATGAWLADVVTDFSGLIVALAAVITAAAAGIAVVAMIGVLLAFFLLRDGGVAWRRAAERLPADRRAEFGEAGNRAVGVLGGYIVGTGVISAVGAASQFLIMVILGLPLALPLAVFAFFAGFIPYIGSFLATGAAFLVAVAFGSTTDIIVMALFTVAFNIVQGSFIAPIVYGRVASIHPAVVLVAIPAGMALGGVLGMFLAVPVIGIVAVTWRSALRVLDPAPSAIPGDTPGSATAPPDPAVADAAPAVRPAPAPGG